MDRKEYMARHREGGHIHREYYGQFVSGEVVQMVERVIGRTAIIQSSDEHFNDIPLRMWDTLANFHTTLLGGAGQDYRPPRAIAVTMARVFGTRTVNVSPSDCICIFKEIAERIREEHYGVTE